MKNRQKDTERLELGLGSQMEKLKRPRSSACLLYALEQETKIIAYRWRRRWGLLLTAESRRQVYLIPVGEVSVGGSIQSLSTQRRKLQWIVSAPPVSRGLRLCYRSLSPRESFATIIRMWCQGSLTSPFPYRGKCLYPLSNLANSIFAISSVHFSGLQFICLIV